jgi:hypothetical protein
VNVPLCFGKWQCTKIVSFSYYLFMENTVEYYRYEFFISVSDPESVQVDPRVNFLDESIPMVDPDPNLLFYL